MVFAPITGPINREVYMVRAPDHFAFIGHEIGDAMARAAREPGVKGNLREMTKVNQDVTSA